MRKFFAWYERYYVWNAAIALTLFLWQLVHLYWLGADVIADKLFGVRYFNVTPFWQYLLIIVDYTEIPAIIATTLFYINELRKTFSWRIVALLILLNSQWLHLFWITDEFVVSALRNSPETILPVWLAWFAILIDYLEIPVIIDVLRRFLQAIRQGRAAEYMREIDLTDKPH